jgi:hypothetical protein
MFFAAGQHPWFVAGRFVDLPADGALHGPDVIRGAVRDLGIIHGLILMRWDGRS